MSFDTLLDVVQARRLTATVYAPERVALAERFDLTNVEVDFRELPADGPRPFVTVYADGAFRGAIDLETLERFHTLDHADGTEGGDRLPPQRAVYRVFEEALFASLRRQQLLAVTREIEAAAWRAGRGTLHVGFQTVPAYRAQASLYDQFAVDRGVDVHVYVGDGDSLTSVHDHVVTLHTEPRETIDRYWFVIYDSAGDGPGKRALVAEQTGAKRFGGTWTRDPALADRAVDALR